MKIEHTFSKALYYLYDIFRNFEKASDEERARQEIIPEPIRFARYFLDHPDESKRAQEAAEEAARLIAADPRFAGK
jgi:hypothetical protein